MTGLITSASLALWSQRDPDEVAADPWAAEVIREFSDYARFLAGHDEWTIDGDLAAPYDVRRAVLMAARRTYTNPDSEVQTGVGPISSRVLDEAALAGAFTESELTLIQGYNEDDEQASGGFGLWVLSTTRGDAPLATRERLCVPDNQQVNLETTNAAPSWEFPLFAEGDPGGEG